MPVSKLSAMPVSKLSSMPVSKLSAMPVSKLSAIPVSKHSANSVSKLVAMPVWTLPPMPVPVNFPLLSVIFPLCLYQNIPLWMHQYFLVYACMNTLPSGCIKLSAVPVSTFTTMSVAIQTFRYAWQHTCIRVRIKCTATPVSKTSPLPVLKLSATYRYVCIQTFRSACIKTFRYPNFSLCLYQKRPIN